MYTWLKHVFGSHQGANQGSLIYSAIRSLAWLKTHQTSAGVNGGLNRRNAGVRHAKPSTKITEDLSPLEVLRRENELLRETINSADSAIEELEAQLQVRQIIIQ